MGVYSRFVVGDSPSVFAGLADPAVRLAIWERPNPCALEGFPAFAEPTEADLSGLPAWLAKDIILLGRLHMTVTGQDWRVRLETAESRTCPAFHEDAVRLRLLVTYRGPGTEWTADLVDPTVRHIPTGAVAAFKGRGWPSTERILHRSAKASIRRPRWLLAMDAAIMTGPVVTDAISPRNHAHGSPG